VSGQIDRLPAWRNVENAIIEDRRWGYGDLISWDDLHALLGIREPGPNESAAKYKAWQLQRLQNVDALRDHMLREHLMYLDTEIGLGLRIVLPAEQTLRVQDKGRKALARALRDMRDGFTHVDTSQLTAEQRKENTDAQVRLAARVQALRPIDRALPRAD
jgi:hypothetical protein